MRVGVPRCLSFHYLFSFYRTFLSELGIDFVETQYSATRDLDNLHLCPTDEPCVSVKTAFSHVSRLLEQGVDALFVPTVISLEEDSYCCPKMMGLPYMLRAAFNLSDSQMISPVIDFKDNYRDWQKTWFEAGRQMGVNDKRKLRNALFRAIKAWRSTDAIMHECHLPASSFLDSPKKGLVIDLTKKQTSQSTNAPVTALMGHSYILNDIFGKTIVKYASSEGPVILPEMVSREDSLKSIRTIFEGEKMWTIESHILGSTLHLIRFGKIDRLILVSAFSCGPLSIIENYVAKEAEKHQIPFLYISVDEHIGEAGLVTRLEAFMDSCRGRDRSVTPIDFSLYGEKEIKTGPFERPIGVVNMGNLGIALKALFREFGINVVVADELSDDTVNLGKELAPEFICYPMVTLLGQMRRLVQSGVSTIVMVQGKGRCRLGWYAQVMEEILNRADLPVRVFSTDSPFPWSTNGRAFLDTWKRLIGVPTPQSVIKAAAIAVRKQALADKSLDILREVRAREQERGAGEERHKRFVQDLDRALSLRDSTAVFFRYRTDMQKIPTVAQEPLKVALVGEIYVMNEPFVNKNVEKLLGSLEQRIRVYRTLDVTNWLGSYVLKSPRALYSHKQIQTAAGEYLPVSVGGHGQESVGEAVFAGRSGFDGVVHLFPFTCMPEIIAQNILVRVSRDLDIPVLSMMISEQTGIAGMKTRLEAFCDLLEGRRKERAG